MNSYSSLLQQGHGQDTLSDTVWLMTFFESASLIGSQVLANWLLGSNPEKGIASSYSAATFMAMIGIMFVSKGWKEKKFANTNLFIFDNYPCLETERKDRGGKG